MKCLQCYRMLLMLCFFNGLYPLAYAQTCTEVIGYYPNWQWYDRAQLVKPSTIQYNKYSIINYAFFKPETNGSISSTDAWADQNLLQGQINWSTTPVSYYPNTSIVSLAHNAGTKVLPSIGGWTLSDNFPSIAASLTKRTLFAHSCCNLIRTYGFDGIDIDWEYPGYVPNSGSINDKQNFTVFMQQIRDSLTALGIQNNQSYLLTFCAGASRQNMLNIEWPQVIGIVDIVNLMSYDFFGSWDATANHNAPLYKPLQGDPTFNIDSAVTYLLNHYQILPSKLAAGLAFYGRSAKTIGTPLLHAPISGVDNITFSSDDGTPLYYNVVAKQNLFTRHWDANAQVPYLLGNGSLNTFVSYDDKESIAIKANYIKSKNLRGVIIWEITGDYLETSLGSGVIAGTPLLDTLNTVFCIGSTGSCNAPGVINANSTTSTLNLSWLSGTASSYNIQYKKQSVTVWDTLSSNTNTILLDSLDCNTIYQVKIQSVCGSLTSNYSSTQNFSTLACITNCTIPNTILSNAGTNTCNVSWSNTGAASYLIQYKKTSETNWQTTTSTTNSILLNGLSANTNYEVRIQSVCGATSSAFSNTVNFTTLNITVTCSHPAWNPPTVYLNGDTVSHNNIIYKAKYWTQNNLPSSNYGDCCAWEYIMPCGGFTAATCYKPLWDGLIAYNTGNQVFWNGLVYVAQWWTLNQNPTSNSGAGAVWQVLSSNPCQVTLQVKSYIQGYYLPANHNMTFADSLTVELRENSPANAYPLIGTYKNILSQNGIINCTYANTVFGKSCYIVLKHKNGLQTWSANPITIGANTTYDFSTAASQVYGNNQSEVENGVWALYSGDINQDQNIDLLDLGLLEIDINSFAFGYLATDINGDGNIDLLDNPVVEANISAFVFSSHP